jgi:hypothetical protein
MYGELTELNKIGATETFNINNKSGTTEVGLLVKSFGRYSNLNRTNDKYDGNYTIEYIRDGQIIQTKTITQEVIGKDTPKLFIEYQSNGIYNLYFLPLDAFNITGQVNIRITVNMPFSIFKNYNGSIYFYHRPYNFNNPLAEYNTPEANRKYTLKLSFITDKETNTSLIDLRQALDAQDTKSVKKQLKANNLSVNTNMMLGKHPLHYAAFHNDVATTKYLITKGADLYHEDELGKNALAYAIENNSTKTIKLLLDAGMKVDSVDFVYSYLAKEKHNKYKKMAPLVYAVFIGDYNLTKLLLEYNATNRYPKNTSIYTILPGFKGKTIKTTEREAYSYLHDIANSKTMSLLLLDHKVQVISDHGPTKKNMRDLYDKCISSYYNCGAINKSLKWEEMNEYLYYEVLFGKEQ